MISLKENTSYTAALQWLERSLDDSSNRRIVISEAFLSANAIANLLMNVTKGLVAFPKVMEKNLKKELPFLCVENVLMLLSKKGEDRQEMHDILRKLCFEQTEALKQGSEENKLIEAIIKHPKLSISSEELEDLLNPYKLTGAADKQTQNWLNELERQLLTFEHVNTTQASITV